VNLKLDRRAPLDGEVENMHFGRQIPLVMEILILVVVFGSHFGSHAQVIHSPRHEMELFRL